MPLLRSSFLFIVLSIAFPLFAEPPQVLPVTAGAGNYMDASVNENEILLYVNLYRQSIGKPALQMIDAASKQAAIHSTNMAKGKTTFGHSGFEERVIKIGVYLGSVHGAAENVAFGQLSAREVVDGWLRSPGHRKNIQGDYSYTGIGMAKDTKGNIFFTQIFLKK